MALRTIWTNGGAYQESGVRAVWTNGGAVQENVSSVGIYAVSSLGDVKTPRNQLFVRDYQLGINLGLIGQDSIYGVPGQVPSFDNSNPILSRDTKRRSEASNFTNFLQRFVFPFSQTNWPNPRGSLRKISDWLHSLFQPPAPPTNLVGIHLINDTMLFSDLISDSVSFSDLTNDTMSDSTLINDQFVI